MAGSWGPAFRLEETPVKRGFHSSQKTHTSEFVPLAGAGGPRSLTRVGHRPVLGELEARGEMRC